MFTALSHAAAGKGGSFVFGACIKNICVCPHQNLAKDKKQQKAGSCLICLNYISLNLPFFKHKTSSSYKQAGAVGNRLLHSQLCCLKFEWLCGLVVKLKSRIKATGFYQISNT